MNKLQLLVAIVGLFFSTSCVLIAAIDGANNNKFVCYFPNWAQFRTGAGQFTVAQINPNLCTHYIYSFALLNGTDFDLIVQDSDKNISDFVALKSKNSNLKSMIAIGGYTDSNDGTDKYSLMVSSSANINTFVNNVLNFVAKFGFDGVDIDWEYPMTSRDKIGFSNLLTALRTAFNPRGYLLSAAVSASPYFIDLGYDVPILNERLDFINLMTYDLHGAGWEPTVADHHAPLYRRSSDTVNLNVNSSVNYWISKGASAAKIVMGIPLYGQSWTIIATTNNVPPAPANGPGIAGPYTQEKGIYSYYEICLNIKDNGWRVVQDPLGQMGPYAYTRLNLPWVGYDDPAFATVKANYIISKGLGGAMVWDISLDDFANLCAGGANPIQTAIAQTMNNQQPISSTTTTTTTATSSNTRPTTTTTTTTVAPTSTTTTTITPPTSTSTVAPTTSTFPPTTTVISSSPTIPSSSTTVPPPPSPSSSSSSSFSTTLQSTPTTSSSTISTTTTIPSTWTSNSSSSTTTTSVTPSTTTVSTTSPTPTATVSTSSTRILPTPSATTVIVSTMKTTTKSPSSSALVCPANGLIANPSSCTSFYSCAFGFFYLMNCPSGLYFNAVVSYCDWPHNVTCAINNNNSNNNNNSP